MIYGKTLIEGNTTDSSGAAIYTAGTLSIKGTTFRGNSTIYSGGAIYFHYPNLEYSERILSIDDCVFEENSGSLGGAITLSASNIVVEEKRGTKANIKTLFSKTIQHLKMKVMLVTVVQFMLRDAPNLILLIVLSRGILLLQAVAVFRYTVVQR